MARLSLATTRRRRLIRLFWNEAMIAVVWYFTTIFKLIAKYKKDKPYVRYSLLNVDRYSILHRYAYESDTIYISHLRMNRRCFKKLCDMLETFGGLQSGRNIGIDEQVAIFLHIIAHNVKNRVIACRFHRSGETVSRIVRRVCSAVIRLHPYLFKKPEPVLEDSTDGRWKWFKNCLGALDGTYIKCLVPLEDRPRYRTRKGDNGFKSGYAQHLQQALEESLPNSGILGKPHIESRIKTMKKDWQVVYDMVHGSNTSGFGFDSEKNCVIAEAPVWDAYLQVHKEAAKWKNKTFPHFEDLCIVFGKDRANGSRVRDAVEMDASMEDRLNESDDNHSDDQDDASYANINVESQECTSGSKKRKNRSESLHEVIKDATFVLGDKLMKASASVVEVEVEMYKKTSMIAGELEKFGTFSEDEMFCALEKITKHPESVITFWSLKEERRENWVRFMLNH